MADLALATPQFNVSETFIADHIRTIAPGRTVVLSDDNPAGRLDAGIPSLDNRTGWRGIAERFRRRFGILDPVIAQADVRRRTAFLVSHNVKVLFVEYLDFAVRMIGVAARAEVPLFAYAHGYEVALGQRDAKLAARYRALFAQARGIIVASRYMAGEVAALGCPIEKIQIIPCGIEPDLFRPTTAEPGRLLAVGRLVEKKAPHLTLEAFARVLDRHPKARLDLIGDGPLRERCEAAIAQLGLGEAAQLHGEQPPEVVRRYMQSAAIFVQHSVTAANGDSEGLGVSLLEAMASRVPVVTTRHNGFIDTVAEGETGLLVEEGDSAAMSEAISSLLDAPNRAREMGQAGRRRVEERFALQRTAERMRTALGLPEAAGMPLAEANTIPRRGTH